MRAHGDAGDRTVCGRPISPKSVVAEHRTGHQCRLVFGRRAAIIGRRRMIIGDGDLQIGCDGVTVNISEHQRDAVNHGTCRMIDRAAQRVGVGDVDGRC